MPAAVRLTFSRAGLLVGVEKALASDFAYYIVEAEALTNDGLQIDLALSASDPKETKETDNGLPLTRSEGSILTAVHDGSRSQDYEEWAAQVLLDSDGDERGTR